MTEFATYDDFDDDDSAPAEQHEGRGPRRVPPRPNRARRRAAAKAQGASARRREAEGVELVALDFHGNTYWVPSDPADWSARALLAFEDGKALTALRALLERDEAGTPGFDTLMATEPRVSELQELFESVARVGGFESSGN